MQACRERRRVFKRMYDAGERDIGALCLAAGISERTAYNYKRQLEEDGDLEPKPLVRGPRKFTAQVRRSLAQRLAKNPEKSSATLADELNERFGVAVSDSGVRRALKKI